MLKKTTVALLGFALSGLSFAGSMGPVCVPGNVTVPCPADHWELGVQALYLDKLATGTAVYLPATGSPFNEVRNDWNWGYKIEGGYHFNTGNDVTINWTHITNETNRADLIGSTGITQGLFPLTHLSKDRLDQVNMVLGQHSDFGLVKKIRFYAGAQFADLRVDTTDYVNVVLPSPPLPFTGVYGYSLAEFRGAGPVIGLDYAYNITNELSLTANSSGSILCGTSRLNSGIVGTPVNLAVTSIYAKKRAMVTGLEAKLGLNYAVPMGQGVLNLAGGYQAMNYFDAIQTVRSINSNDSNYGVYGPYMGLKYVG